MNNCYLGKFEDNLDKIPLVDHIITDIPYNISKDSNFKGMKDRKNRIGLNFGEWDHNFDINILKLLLPKLKDGGSIILFHSFEQFAELRKVFAELDFKDKIIWQKTNSMPRNRDRRYINNIEIASWYVKKGKWVFNRQDKYEQCVFTFPSESGGGFKRFHPTQKNLNLIKKLILIHTNKNDLVLDPFAGSGTTLLACKHLKRNFLGFEALKKHYNIIKERVLYQKQLD